MTQNCVITGVSTGLTQLYTPMTFALLEDSGWYPRLFCLTLLLRIGCLMLSFRVILAVMQVLCELGVYEH